jgi:hypothetical protein
VTVIRRRGATLTRMLQTRCRSARRRAKQECVPFGLFGAEAIDVPLLALWNKQEGRGHYTREPLGHAPAHNWVVSIERFRKAGGYIWSNICLEVFEANTQRQWSRGFADAIWGDVA